MHNLYIFDIDGTLTPSRKRMSAEFSKFFNEWTDDNNYYLVTGSDIKKVKEQIPILYLERSQGVFTCCGNEFYKTKVKKWKDKEEIDLIKSYENKFTPPNGFIDYLESKLNNSKYHHRAGNHIEDRGSMINFSIVGRNCSLMERENYFKYDNENGERKKIVDEMKEKWPTLESSIGGQISIDIYEPGMDKSQIYSHITKNFIGLIDKVVFIGDRTMKGGNDYPISELIKNKKNGLSYQTEGPEQTMEILQWLQIDGETK